MSPRPFLFAAALAALAPAATAQTTFGLKAGLNVSTITLDDDAEALFDAAGVEIQPRLGLVAGVFANLPLTPQLSLRPEVLFAQKGYTLSAADEDFDFSVTQQIDYVEVPLMLNYRALVGQNGLAIGVEAGPTFAYKVSTGTSCSGDDSVPALCDDFDTPENGDDGVRDYDLSGALGLTVGAGPFDVGARYTQGLTTIDDTEGQEDEQDNNIRNRTFSFTAAYSF